MARLTCHYGPTLRAHEPKDARTMHGALPHHLALALACLMALAANVGTQAIAAAPRARGEVLTSAVAECTEMQGAAGSGVRAVLSTFREDGVYRFAVIHIDFTAFPAAFLADDHAFVTFEVWKQVGQGQREVRPLKARLFLYDKERGLILRRAPLDRISHNTFDAVRALHGLAPAEYPIGALFEHFSVLLSDIDESWEGVTVRGLSGEHGEITAFAVEAWMPPVALVPATAATAQMRAAALCAEFDRDVVHTRGATDGGPGAVNR